MFGISTWCLNPHSLVCNPATEVILWCSNASLVTLTDKGKFDHNLTTAKHSANLEYNYYGVTCVKKLWQLNLVCHPYDIRCHHKSSGWPNYLIQMTYGECSISTGSLKTNVLCHPDEIRSFPKSSGCDNVIQNMTLFDLKSSGWIRSRPYLIRMNYGQCAMSSVWPTKLP